MNHSFKTDMGLSIKVDDDSMMDYGIYPDDVVVASPIAYPEDGEVIIAMLNGQILLRKYFNIGNKICLTPENVNYPTIELNEMDDFEIVGVVKQIINTRKIFVAHA